MSDKNKKKCIVTTEEGQIGGTVLNEYEELGGADDGALFAVIELDNGQLITVKMSELLDI